MEVNMQSLVRDKKLFRGRIVSEQEREAQWLEAAIAKGAHAPHAEVVTVSPMLAKIILQRNHDNRNFRPKKVEHYATDMVNGLWQFNLEPIIISDTGELNDGQHRMQAVIDANIAQKFLFAFGASRESRMTVDQGAARCAADYLAMDGVKNATTIAGVARVVMAYEKAQGHSIGMASGFTNVQITERVHSDPDLGPSAEFAQAVSKYAKGILQPSLIGALHYILRKVDANATEDYLGRMCMGENIKRGDPAFAVRTALSNMEAENKTARFEIVLRGWNAHRQNRPLQFSRAVGTFPVLI